jgi:hypothetical protein
MKTIEDQVWNDIWNLRYDVFGRSYTTFIQYVGKTLLDNLRTSVYKEEFMMNAIQDRIEVSLTEICYI